MTLTAIDADKQLHSPSVLIEMGDGRTNVVQEMRERQRHGFFCPHCYDKIGELIPVRFRNPESRRVHFYHVEQSGEAKRECANYCGESEKHKLAKVAVQESLKRKGLLDTTLEVRMQIDNGLPWRRPDVVVVYPVGTTEAHEIQVSYINSDELEQRTKGLRYHGANRVVWYLYGKNFNPENRSWCHKNGVECHHLFFEDSDVSKPRWKKDLFVPEKPKPVEPKREKTSSTGSDKCDRGSALADRQPQATQKSYWNSVAQRNPGDRRSSLAERAPWKPRKEKPQKLPEKPVFKPDPIEFCYVPFRIDSWVRLKVAPSRIYTVLAVKTCVSFIKSEGAHSHDYQLLSREGKPAFWCHSQLEEMQ